MNLSSDVQRLTVGEKITLFYLDARAFDGPELYFHGHAIPDRCGEADSRNTAPAAASLWWQGIEYKPWPITADGFEMTSDGSSPSPTLQVANCDGHLSALCLAYRNLVQAKLRRRVTFVHYLDAKNFPHGNPDADPTKEKCDLYYIDRKISEDDKSITFALSSPSDLQGMLIPSRQIHSLCTWCIRGQYRGASCGYTGSACVDIDGNPTDDPARDVCSGLLSTGCVPRFGKGNPLPFGGFPGSSLLKR